MWKYSTFNNVLPFVIIILTVQSMICFFLSVIRSRARSTDMKQQQPEFIQTEEWTCVKSIKETKTSTQEDERIEVDSDES